MGRLINKEYFEDIDNLSKILVHLPLALYQSAAYMNIEHTKYGKLGLDYTIKNYLDEYIENANNMLNYSDDKRYLYTVYTTWLITF